MEKCYVEIVYRKRNDKNPHIALVALPAAECEGRRICDIANQAKAALEKNIGTMVSVFDYRYMGHDIQIIEVGE